MIRFDKPAKRSMEDLLNDPVYQAQRQMMGLPHRTAADLHQRTAGSDGLADEIKARHDGTYGLRPDQIRNYQQVANYYNERFHRYADIGYTITVRDMSKSDEGEIKQVEKNYTSLKTVRYTAEKKNYMLVGYAEDRRGNVVWDAYSSDHPEEVTTFTNGDSGVYSVNDLDKALRHQAALGRGLPDYQGGNNGYGGSQFGG